MGDDWSQPEMVRAITRLSEVLENFEKSVEETFKGLDRRYVTREVFDVEVKRLNDALDSRRAWTRDLVAPLVSGLVVGLVVLWVTTHLH